MAPVAARAAIVHDWFQGFHGSERVVDALLGLFSPTPEVHTFTAARELLPPRLAEAIVQESRIAGLPGLRQQGHVPGRWRYLLPYMPRYFSSLDLDGYDAVIVSSHACAVGARPRDGALHVCYCHTPMRYVWMPDTDAGRVAGPPGVALRALRGRLREWDRRAAQRPDVYVANSSAVAERIARWYGREARVIPPPVALQDFLPAAVKQPGHFLWVHRLVPYKRPLEVARAFAQLPDLRLTMVGIGPLEEALRAELPANVELRGWVEREELAALQQASAGFIHVGEEDFGITMVEALAAGSPVLAAPAGGSRDIVQEGVNGTFVEDPTDPASIAEGVRRLAAGDWPAERMRAHAERFSEAAFHERMAALLREHGVG